MSSSKLDAPDAILTIGYEGSSIHDFIATLKLANVHILLDIRDVPVSRKHGFSKNSLSDTLKNNGIEYVHLRGLGNPKLGRDAARRGDMRTFRRIFRAHLKLKEAQEALHQALELAAGTRACLLCFERDHAVCHRVIVAEEMANRNAVEIRHLGVRQGLSENTGYGGLDNERAYAFG